MHSDFADLCMLQKKFYVDLCNNLSHYIHKFSFILISFKNLHLDYKLYLIAMMLQWHDKILVNFNLFTLILN